MRVGDKDGIDDIYDENGELVLKEDEQLLVKEDNVVPSFKTTWRKFGGEDVIDPMNGVVYLTNRRFVFIATPENIGRIGGGAADGPKSYGVQMGSVGVKGTGSGSARDYFELLVKELIACEIAEGVVSAGQQISAYVMAGGEQYKLSFLAQDDSELLKRFRKNTVENVDELVANLKKYFENSDWVYG
jgi:hypothetical protein